MSVELTRAQVREVDRIAIAEFGMSGLVLMENAGRNAADLILDDRAMRLAAIDRSRVHRVVVVCGVGNNGGDGFVIARHLANRSDWDVVTVVIGDSARFSPDAGANHAICVAMGIAVERELPDLGEGDLVVDALLGTGFSGDVREEAAGAICTINESPIVGVVAADVPSGLDCDTGEPSNATVEAGATVTFVASKVGFARKTAARYVGKVFVVDIGSPAVIVDRVLAS